MHHVTPISIIAEWSYRSATSTHDAHMTGSAFDLTRQIAEMQAQGYTVSRVVSHVFCGVCHGSGRISGRKLYSSKPCVACKGHDGPMSSRDVFTA